jgi:hypothetical protein
MAIDITGANAYFGATVNTRSETWTKIPLPRRVAAVAQAKDLIQSKFDAALETDTTVAGDFPRHDAAVYEQALWMLEMDTMDASLKAQMIDPKQIGSLAANLRAVQSLNTMLTPLAVRFIYLNTISVRLSRG